MINFFIFLLIILAGVPLALLRGVVLSDMWGWFITPLGVPPIGVVHAIGISFVVTFFTTHLKTNHEKTDNEKWYAPVLTRMISGIVISLTFWLFAWLWHLFL